jgi:hypothetical protein
MVIKVDGSLVSNNGFHVLQINNMMYDHVCKDVVVVVVVSH